MTEKSSDLLQFPTPYPIKVVCRRRDDLRAIIDDVVRRHCPDLTESDIGERDSNARNFVSITYRIVARSAEHATALIGDLQRHEAVIMVL